MKRLCILLAVINFRTSYYHQRGSIIARSEFLIELCRRMECCTRRETVTITPRVVLADDQKEILQSVVLTIGDEFSVVGTAENGAGAVELATQTIPPML